MGVARRINTIIRKLLRPSGVIVALAPVAVALMMCWVFMLGNEGHPLSYVAYAASAYLFAVICIWVVKDVPARKASALIRCNPHCARFLDDEDLRRQSFVLVGIVIDVLWAVGNLALGAFQASVWFIALGVYYLVFGLMRCALFVNLRKGMSCTGKEQARTSRACGIVLIGSVLILSGIVTLIMTGDGTIRYDQIIVIAVATFTFYSFISSIVGLVRLRAHENLLVSTNCRVNLSIALVSIFTLEIGMFSAFATADDAPLVFIMPIITGMVIALALVILGTMTIARANRELSSLQK